jgi:hypothetical protein
MKKHTKHFFISLILFSVTAIQLLYLFKDNIKNKAATDKTTANKTEVEFFKFARLMGISNIEVLSRLTGVIDLKSNFFNEPAVTLKNDKSIAIKNNSINDYLEYNSELIPVNKPFRLLVDFENIGKRSSITITGDMGKDNRPSWWDGLVRIYVHRYQNNDLILEIRDGKSADSFALIKLNTTKQSIIMEFVDKSGKQINILTENGNMIEEIYIPELEGVDLPNGLFINGSAYFGISVAPKTTMKLNSFYLYKEE